MKKPMISFENYSFHYRSQAEPTLKNINLTIYEGEKIVIVGHSGSGKSTLAHCINGLVPFSYKGTISGSLKIAGKEAKDQNIFALSALVGTVLQDPDGQFIGLTVGEDIAFSLENDCVETDVMQRRTLEAAKLLDIDHRLTHRVHQLSGGQKQRTALAGVMIDNVPILLFDEPLANLDPAAGKYAIELIDRIHQEAKTTTIIVEHRLEDVLHRKADRIIVMNEGQIVGDMPPNELLASDILAKYTLREPLYITALKHAGCDLPADGGLEHIQKLDIDEFKDKLNHFPNTRAPGKTRHDAAPILELRDLHFSYRNGQQLLKNISTVISKGEMVSIVGKNGTGKTTLAKLLCGFENPAQGRIVYNGEDMTNNTIKEFSLRVGMVMQNPNQMISKHMIFDEVALGLRVRGVPEAEIKQQVNRTLKICGLYPFRNWPVSALSFGQKKRVTIAAILVLKPEVMILDEPTAGQDFRHYTDIMEFLLELNRQGITILMITHDMHLMLEYTSRAIVIGNGTILADDTPANILTDREVTKLAHLKETSLYALAVRAGLEHPREFVQQFIDYDREVRQHGSRNVILS
ncbi:energy-coupling factor transport system ATP-binding protein [Evansella caseinilytica]|uniref:Energy-coupling factor transport system ATP-binding protein n=1 Tax=Evansella caseinilytica TaxID=1503961 RepID=A0A1H3R9E4_9BACI|nr:ABC transporter ATP-binding protein [Evansella caseinilytica]SDZ22394.1 energy-coupling factor transport system ATP-binding protein [Evansella caseinilytica]